jgi:hypothetical protein
MANAKFASIFEGDYSQEPVRPCFFWLWIFLFSTRRRLEPAVGRVGLRIVGGLMASKSDHAVFHDTPGCCETARDELG